MRKAVLAGTVATSLFAGAAAGMLVGVPVSAQSGERGGALPAVSIPAVTMAAITAAIPATAAPAAAPAPAAPAAAPAVAAPLIAPVAAAHAKAPASLPAVAAPASAALAAATGSDDAGGELAVVAAALHMALSDLKAGLAAGKSMAQLAAAAGVDPSQLIAAVVNDATAKINAALALHKLAMAQADQIIAMLPSLVTDVVNQCLTSIGAAFGPGSKLPVSLANLGDLASLGNFANLGHLMHMGDLASFANMGNLPALTKPGSIGDFKSFFNDMFGSLGQANPGANIDPQALISSIVSMVTDAVNTAQSAGLLAQAQANAILSNLTPAITSLVQHLLDAGFNLSNQVSHQAQGWASLGSSWMAHLHH